MTTSNLVINTLLFTFTLFGSIAIMQEKDVVKYKPTMYNVVISACSKDY